MSKPLFTVLTISKVDKEVVSINFLSFTSEDVNAVVNYLKHKDLDSIAIWKEYKHIQFPTKPMKDEDIKRILMEA